MKNQVELRLETPSDTKATDTEALCESNCPTKILPSRLSELACAELLQACTSALTVFAC